MIAHRGLINKNIKENTFEAFDNALLYNFDGIEFDIRETKDGKCVIIHDNFINRTSDGTGLVKKYKYNELKKFNFGTNTKPSKIPLFKDVLRKYKCIKLCELKERIDLSKFINLLDNKTYIMSFDSNYIFELKKKYPFLKLGILNDVINYKFNYDLDFICIPEIICTDSLINYYLNKNIIVFIYGIIGNKIKFKKRKNLHFIVDKIP